MKNKILAAQQEDAARRLIQMVLTREGLSPVEDPQTLEKNGDLPGEHHRQRQHRPGADHHHGRPPGGPAGPHRRVTDGPAGVWPPGHQLPWPLGDGGGPGTAPDPKGI